MLRTSSLHTLLVGSGPDDAAAVTGMLIAGALTLAAVFVFVIGLAFCSPELHADSDYDTLRRQRRRARVALPLIYVVTLALVFSAMMVTVFRQAVGEIVGL